MLTADAVASVLDNAQAREVSRLVLFPPLLVFALAIPMTLWAFYASPVFWWYVAYVFVAIAANMWTQLRLVKIARAPEPYEGQFSYLDAMGESLRSERR